MKFNFKINIVLLPTLLMLSGCYKDNLTENNTVIEPQPDIIIDHNLLGHINDENDTQLEDWALVYNNQIIDKTGSYFYLEAEKVNKFKEVLQISNSKFSYEYITPLIENQTNYNHYIFPKNYEQRSTSSSSSFFYSNDVYQIDIDADSYSKNSIPLQGNIDFFLLNTDFKDEGIYPGGSLYIDENNKTSLVKPEHFLSIKSDQIDKFNGTISLKTSAKNLYHYNSELNHYELIQNQNITKTGWYAIGSHTDYVILTGTARIDENTTNGEPLKLIHHSFSKPVTTTDQGKYICYAPQNSNFQLTRENDCGLENIDIVTNSDDLTKDAFFSSTENSFIVQAEIKDCELQKINKAIVNISTDEYSLVRYVETGDLKVTVPKCKDKTQLVHIFGKALGSHATSPIQNYSINDNTYLNDFYICEDLGEEYLVLKTEDEYYHFIMASTQLIDDRVKFIFSQVSNPENQLSLWIPKNTKADIDNEEINIVLEGSSLGNQGYELKCEESPIGCGFDQFKLTHIGSSIDEYYRGYFEGNFWVKIFNPTKKAGYKKMEAQFHVKRTF